MSNMAVVIYQSLGSSYVGEVGVAHHFSVFGFLVCFACLHLCVLYSMLPVFLDCLFLLAVSCFSNWIICNYEKTKVILSQE